MKKAGIREVAKEAGVSITTVSRALNGYPDVSDATREHIYRIVEQLNYAPNASARSLGGKATKMIALLLSGMKEREESGFVYGMISGMYHAALEQDYDFIILTTDRAKQAKMNYLQLCRLKGIEGVAIAGIKMDDPYYKELAKSAIPCVVVDASLEGEHVCSLSVDNEKAACEAVMHLLSFGHRQIALMNGDPQAAVSASRYAGYCKAFQDMDIPLNKDYIFGCDFKEEIAYEKTRECLTRHPQVTAFFCASDVMAAGVVQAVTDSGRRIPQDISVIGFDDIPIAKYVGGGLTTIHQDPYQIGYQGGNALIHMAQTGEKKHSILAEYALIQRNTVGKVNNEKKK